MMKTMLITYFDMKVIVHLEFIPQGQTVNRIYYVQILKRLHETVQRKRPELWPKDWIHHHDIVPAYKALSRDFWPKNGLLKWNTFPFPLV
jgi:hypothetical protein